MEKDKKADEEALIMPKNLNKGDMILIIESKSYPQTVGKVVEITATHYPSTDKNYYSVKDMKTGASYSIYNGYDSRHDKFRIATRKDRAIELKAEMVSIQKKHYTQ